MTTATEYCKSHLETLFPLLRGREEAALEDLPCPEPFAGISIASQAFFKV